MKSRIWKIGILFGIIILFVGASIFPSISGMFSEKMQNKDLKTVNFFKEEGTQYWGVCIVAFDDENDAIKEPFIYNSLLQADNWDEVHLKLLFREEATRNAILGSLDWLIDNADEDDVVLFSDHSHGTYRRSDKKYGIVPIDSEISGIITVEELDEKFDLIKAKELCLIFDCCLAGNFVEKNHIDVNKNNKNVFYNKGFTQGIEGDNRIVLMSTMRYGLGIGISVNVSGHQTHFSFHRFVGDALGEKIDYNNDGVCSAEESYNYAQEKWRPYAFTSLFMIRMQIVSLLTFGFLIIPFPTLYDNIQGELPIVY